MEQLTANTGQLFYCGDEICKDEKIDCSVFLTRDEAEALHAIKQIKREAGGACDYSISHRG